MAKTFDKTIVITGATSGIGEACAMQFATKPFNIAVVGRNAERGAEVVAAIETAGGAAKFFACDIRDLSAVESLFAAVGQAYGGIDILINNAGVEQKNNLICDTDDEEMARIIDTDLKGTWKCTKAALPLLRPRRGVIVNISSFWGEVGMVGGSSYAAAKGGIIALTRAIAAEEGAQGSGVRVNCVSPGAIQTAMLDRVQADANLDIDEWAEASTLLKRKASAEELANVVMFLATDASSYMTGQTLTVDGGYTII